MKATLFSLLFVCCAGNSVFSAFVFSPRTGSSNSATLYPFFARTNNAPSVRFQQVYQGGDFSGYGFTPSVFITGLSLRGAGTGPGQPFTLSNVQINLSSTFKAPDGLSNIFADNVGADDTIVYSGPLDIFQGDRFGFYIEFRRPFVFPWQVANLLFDVRNFQTAAPDPFGGMPAFLTERSLGDTVSMIWARDVNSPTAEFMVTDGIFTVFYVEPIPEPGTVVILAFGFCGIVLLWLRRRRLVGKEQMHGAH